MKKLAATVLSMLMVLTACGGVSEDADKYIAYSISMLGIDMEPSEVYDEDVVLALDENGKAMLSLDGEDYNCEWEMDGDVFTLSQGSDEFTGDISSDTTSNDIESSTTLFEDFVAPGYGAENTVPVETLSNPSEWYGMINITNYEGPYIDGMEGEHEARGKLSSDDKGDYFELYVDGIYEGESVILSYYAEVYDDTFYPIADESAWIFDIDLTVDDEIWYTPTLLNGVLSASYDYRDDDESFTFTYQLAMIEGSDTE